MKLIDRQKVDTNKIRYQQDYTVIGPSAARLSIMKQMNCLSPKVLVTRTVPQSRALFDNFWFVANVKVYECKIWGYQFWTVLMGCAHLQSPWSQAKSLFGFGRPIVQYFAVFIRFSGDCMKHFKTWALLYWWRIRRRGPKFPQEAGPLALPLALIIIIIIIM